jgi:hypothetical protein
LACWHVGIFSLLFSLVKHLTVVFIDLDSKTKKLSETPKFGNLKGFFRHVGLLACRHFQPIVQPRR